VGDARHALRWLVRGLSVVALASISVAAPSTPATAQQALFTWHDDPAENHRELDVEIARWGDPAGPNARYTIQPDHTCDFETPAVAVPTTHRIDWQPDQVRFQSWEGWDAEPAAPGATIAEHKFDTGIPRPGGEQTRINLWLNGGAAPLPDGGLEAIVSSFEFLPPTPNSGDLP